VGRTLTRMTQRELQELSPELCAELLRTARVGRLVYVEDECPVAVPVNYAMSGNDIVIRVEGGAKQAAVAQPMLAFEVDSINEDERSGWSVLARGTAREVATDYVPDLLREIEGQPPLPWATGIHNVWLALTPQALTGKRLGAEHSANAF
jgi:hypothetical protein